MRIRRAEQRVVSIASDPTTRSMIRIAPSTPDTRWRMRDAR
jgi:hypothetical protein